MIYYVALPFTPEDRGGLAPGQPVECPSAAAAIRRAEAIARLDANAGAVAFSRRGGHNLGEFDDAVILKAFGEVPDDFPVRVNTPTPKAPCETSAAPRAVEPLARWDRHPQGRDPHPDTFRLCESR
jgi:hypothetical protein